MCQTAVTFQSFQSTVSSQFIHANPPNYQASQTQAKHFEMSVRKADRIVPNVY